MSRWQRIVRGMLGMGLTFSVGAGLIASLVAALAWLLPGGDSAPELARMVVGSAVWAFPIGVAFSGLMALTARGRRFEELSVLRFAALGAGAGLALFGVLALNAWDAWTVDAAVANATILVSLGAGTATASLLVARKAGSALGSGAERDRLAEGEPEGR